MDFDFTEEQKILRTSVREFLEKEIAPVVDERDRQGPFTHDEVAGFTKKLMPFGYYIGNLPERYGGLGLDHVTQGLLMEELCRVWASLGATFFIASQGTGAVRLPRGEERFLPKILAGELFGCAGITEPNIGSDDAHVETTAVLDGGEYVVNGTKTWISCGTIADICSVRVALDRSKGRAGQATITVVKEDSPWESRELHKLGWRAFPTGELSFVDCRVSKENLLVPAPREPGAPPPVGFAGARSMMAAMSAGTCQAAIDASIKYAQERIQFGRPIASFQLIQEMIADMIAETDAARLLAYRALWLLDKGAPCRLESSLAKAYATEAAISVTSKAIQIHGAVGLSDDYPVERYFRDARMLTIPDGTTQIQKLIVGRQATGIRAYE